MTDIGFDDTGGGWNAASENAYFDRQVDSRRWADGFPFEGVPDDPADAREAPITRGEDPMFP